MNELFKFQRKLLEMLLEVDKILKKHNISYFLVGGSVLGVIRHKGFIPWDDDIDIGFFPNDFKKMEEILQTELNLNRMYCKIGENKFPNAPIGYLYDISDPTKNLQQVPTIDFFIIDNVPEKKILREIQRIFSLLYHLCIYRMPAKNRGKKAYYITKFLLKITPNYILDFFQKISKYITEYWNDTETKNVCNLYGAKKYYGEIMPKEYIGKPILKDFEGYSLPVPEKYHDYLTHLYGDYMELPPEKDRKPQHKTF